MKVSAEYSIYVLRKKDQQRLSGIFTQMSDPSTVSEVTAVTNRTSDCSIRTPTLSNLRNDSCMNRSSDSNVFGVKNYPNIVTSEGTLSQNSFLVSKAVELLKIEVCRGH